MLIHYEKLHEDTLAIRICPLDDQAPFVEINLLAYNADGTRCWLPPEVRSCPLRHGSTREAAAMKQATGLAARIVGSLQAVADPAQALEAMHLYGMAEAA